MKTRAFGVLILPCSPLFSLVLKRACKTVLLFVVAFIIGLLFLSCNRDSSPLKSTDKPADAHPLPEDALEVPITGKYGGRIVTAILSEPQTFNQILFADETSQVLNQLMSPGLTRLNLKTQDIEPALAKSIEEGANHLSYTFHLRKGLRWSDGKPFTAADVIFTMGIINDKNIPSAAQDAIGGTTWQHVDDHTVVAILPKIHVAFLRQLDGGTTPIISKHKWEPVYRQGKFQEAMQISMKPEDFVSIGAFTLKEYKPGEYFTLKKNPYYWKKDQEGKRLPYLDELIFQTIPGQDQIALKIQNGELDTFYTIRPGDLDAVLQKADKLKLDVLRVGPSLDPDMMWFNQNGDRNPKTGKPYVSEIKRAWFSDVNFRRAVSHAINRDAIVQNALFGRGVVTYGQESVSNTRWHNPNITRYPHDPGRALELLKASGFTQQVDSLGNPQLLDRKRNPVRFSLHTNAKNTLRETACTLIASDLAKLGVKVDFTPLDFNTLVTKIQDSYDYDAMYLSLTHDDMDPSSGLNVYPSYGTSHFWWPKQKSPQTTWERRIDELMLMQLNTVNYSERKKYYDEVQKIISEQQPMIFTATQLTHVCLRKNLGNVKPTLSRHRTLWNADELYWK